MSKKPRLRLGRNLPRAQRLRNLQEFLQPPEEAPEPLISCRHEDSWGRCGNPPVEGALYCQKHLSRKEIIQATLTKDNFAALQTGPTLDVLHAHLERLDEEDRQFIMKVYGDSSLDTEIAFLRLVIAKLMSGTNMTHQYQHLPRLVQSLAAAHNEAVKMLQGNKLTVEFTTKNGQEYWKELFRSFARLLEEGLSVQLCPTCRERVALFVQGGMHGDILGENDNIIMEN